MQHQRRVLDVTSILRIRLAHTDCPDERKRLIEQAAAASDVVPTPHYQMSDWERGGLSGWPESAESRQETK